VRLHLSLFYELGQGSGKDTVPFVVFTWGSFLWIFLAMQTIDPRDEFTGVLYVTL